MKLLMVCSFLLLVSAGLGQDLNLVENGYTEEEADGECFVQPVVVKVELVGELHYLRPSGVGVWKWSARHFAL